jgi:hypothetical protein
VERQKVRQKWFLYFNQRGGERWWKGGRVRVADLVQAWAAERQQVQQNSSYISIREEGESR